MVVAVVPMSKFISPTIFYKSPVIQIPMSHPAIFFVDFVLYDLPFLKRVHSVGGTANYAPGKDSQHT